MIFFAAQLLAAGWIFSVLSWRLLDDEMLHLALVLQDSSFAYIFFRMSRGRWFPVPLFGIHVLMLTHNLAIAAFGIEDALVSLVLNRLFELALVYVGACAAYRIRMRKLDAQMRKAPHEPPLPRE